MATRSNSTCFAMYVFGGTGVYQFCWNGEGLSIKEKDGVINIHLSCSLGVFMSEGMGDIKARIVCIGEGHTPRASTFLGHSQPLYEQEGGQGQQESDKMYVTEGGHWSRV